ncbi:hypothetical protein HK102_009316, partial [Quaeritorhiza haematococci]
MSLTSLATAIVSPVYNFAKRNKRRILTVGGLVGGVWVLGKYAKWKLLELAEQSELDRAARSNEQLLVELNVEGITARLQQARQQQQQQQQGNATEQQ